MFIGLCGGICVGKSTIANFLVAEFGFTRLHLKRDDAEETELHDLQKVKSSKDEFFTFDDSEALLDYVTAKWQHNWVTTDVCSLEVVESYAKRPFFLLISVDAPILCRFERYAKRCRAQSLSRPELWKFVEDIDELWYSSEKGLAPVHQKATLHIVNNNNDLESLHLALWTMDLPNEARLRPSWDQYFMQLADLASHRSNCMKRRVGCVLVRDKRVISTGYNGTPRGMKNCSEGGCPRCNSSARGGTALDTCMCLHAEENALLEAGRERIGKGSILYCDTCPCLTCSVKIAQVGISEVVYSKDYAVDSVSAKVLSEAGVTIRQFSPPRGGLLNVEAMCEGFKPIEENEES